MTTILALLLSFFGTAETLVSERVDSESSAYIKKIIQKDIGTQTVSSFGEVAEPCSDILEPLSNNQSAKDYHQEFTITFDRLLPGPSPFCQVPQRVTPKCKPNRRPRQQSLEDCLWKNQRCLGLKRLKIKLLSDLYSDSCGRQLRGFALVHYTIPGEHIEDSVSPGHTLELVQQFSSGGDYRAGPSYPVEKSRFLFFIDEK